ncbi:MAG: glycerol-3-phosphate acyltransferase, partial [Clostridia bacterium]|nr:glycerol-3-phosphate acyltransferase [Clostridia bacterium]
MNGWLLAILCVVSYFLGNINFGKIIAKSKNVDLSKSGSGNLGATNMYRTMGAKLGYLTLLLDASKGIIP